LQKKTTLESPKEANMPKPKEEKQQCKPKKEIQQYQRASKASYLIPNPHVIQQPPKTP
jgi:hypothetical protein